MKEHCYMCDAEAVSQEHAPPLCIFPEANDMQDGRDYRRNLITVPACDAHNLHKSKDDEYLRLLLVHGYFNNPLAEKQFKTKLVRAFTRRPALLAAFHSENNSVVVDGIPTEAVTIDRPRFDRSLEMVIRALYFAVFQERLAYPVRVHSPIFLDMESRDADRRNEMVRTFCLAVREHLRDAEVHGENPEIFWFKIKHRGPAHFVSCQMCFYGGFDVFAAATSRFHEA